MKDVVLSFVSRVSLLINDEVFRKTIMAVIRRRVMKAPSAKGLSFLLKLDNDLYRLQGECALRYGKGIHPKHRLIRYHDFFVLRLRAGERVLDVGCGRGELAWDMAEKGGAHVVAVDLDEEKISEAKMHHAHSRIQYLQGNILEGIPEGNYDVIVLSNLLEHLESRVVFLEKLLQKVGAGRYLIRVPMFERDWRVPLKAELDVDYRLDPTHCLEYTREQFLQELTEAGLHVVDVEIRWGEIWAEAVADGPR